MPKPRVIMTSATNQNAAPNECIIEFYGTDPDHGGLISIEFRNDGRMRVHVYRHGAKVDVGIGPQNEPVV